MMDFGCGIIFAHVAPPVDWSKSSSIWFFNMSLAPELIGRAVPQLKTTRRLFQRLELIRNWRAKCWSALSTRPSDNSRRYFVLISSFIRPFLPFFASEINYAIGFFSFSYSMPSIELLSNCWLCDLVISETKTLSCTKMIWLIFSLPMTSSILYPSR